MNQASTATATAHHADASLLASVNSALTASPYLEATRLRIEAEQGAVSLHGEVGTFFEKQMAQEVIRRLDGVERIVNQLQVSWR